MFENYKPPELQPQPKPKNKFMPKEIPKKPDGTQIYYKIPCAPRKKNIFDAFERVIDEFKDAEFRNERGSKN